MCGISLTLDPDAHELTAHRGVETRIEVLGDFTAAFHRLPIQTQLGDSWTQPFELPGGGLIFFNGEIFDVPEGFKNDLEYLVFLWDTRTPKQFFECLMQRDGFFAVMIYSRGRIMFTTDPMGKKLLYYNDAGEICSEIGGLPFTGINKEYMASVGAQGYHVGSDTPFKNIHRAVPGVVYSAALGAKPEPNFRPELQIIPRFGIAQSVGSRTVGFEPIGCFVSGGLDSTIIAYHLKDYTNVKFYTISNGEDDQYIPVLEDFLRKPIQRLSMQPSYKPTEVLRANESPQDMGSMVPQFRLFEAAQETVIMTGDGADELFGGYRRSQYYDSQPQDLLELTYYHLPRIDKMSMYFTREARQPFLANYIIEFAKDLPYSERTDKKFLREYYKDILPAEIINRKKEPLKSAEVRADEKINRYKLIQKFYEIYENTGR